MVLVSSTLYRTVVIRLNDHGHPGPRLDMELWMGVLVFYLCRGLRVLTSKGPNSLPWDQLGTINTPKVHQIGLEKKLAWIPSLNGTFTKITQYNLMFHIIMNVSSKYSFYHRPCGVVGSF